MYRYLKEKRKWNGDRAKDKLEQANNESDLNKLWFFTDDIELMNNESMFKNKVYAEILVTFLPFAVQSSLKKKKTNNYC